MKERLIKDVMALLRKARLKFLNLHYHRQIYAIFAAAGLIILFIGPVYLATSDISHLKEESLNRARNIVRLIAAKNAPLLASGRDVFYDVDSFRTDSGVMDTYITDSAGLIVAPANRFHEDARKNDLILQGLKQPDLVEINKGGVYELVQPIQYGDLRVGAAYLAFSGEVYKFSAWQVIKTMVLIGAIMALASIVVIRIIDNKFDSSLDVGAEEQDTTGKGASQSVVNYVRAPVIFFDDTFRVIYCNSAAIERHGHITNKHIVDLGRKYMEMAEEMEMLKSEKVEGDGGAVLWKMNDGGGYGLTY